MSELLLEYWGNIRAISSEALRYIKSNARGTILLGPNSKVLISKKMPADTFVKVKHEYGDSEIEKLEPNLSMIGFVIRYNQDDLAVCTREYSSFKVHEMSDYDLITNGARTVWTEPKSLSGLNKLMGEFATNIAEKKGISKKEVLDKMDYQIVYADEEAMKKSEKRRITAYDMNKLGYRKNDKDSGYKFQDEDAKEMLKDRLKAFIDNKLPNLDQIKATKNPFDIVKNMHDFVIKRYKYTITSSDINIGKLLDGKNEYLVYNCDGYYSLDNKIDAPRYICFQIALNNNTLEVSNIFGTNSYYQTNELKPIEDYTFMPIKQESKMYKSSVGKLMEKYFGILKEGVQELKKYFPKIDDNTFEALIRLDPTYKGGEQLGKYGKWILSLYNNKFWNEKQIANNNPSAVKPDLKEEDFYKVPQALTLYDKFANRIKIKLQDIKSLPDLNQIVSPYENQKEDLSNNALEREAKKDAEKVFDNEDWLVIIPKSYQASCYYGKGTKWCTASNISSYDYDRYTNDGPLFININKETGKKYQFHFETNQYMNEMDRRIDLYKLLENNPKLAKFYANYFNEHTELVKNDIEYPIFLLEYLPDMSEETFNIVSHYVLDENKTKRLYDILTIMKHHSDYSWVKPMMEKIKSETSENVLKLNNDTDTVKNIALDLSRAVIQGKPRIQETMRIVKMALVSDIQEKLTRYMDANYDRIKELSKNAYLLAPLLSEPNTDDILTALDMFGQEKKEYDFYIKNMPCSDYLIKQLKNMKSYRYRNITSNEVEIISKYLIRYMPNIENNERYIEILKSLIFDEEHALEKYICSKTDPAYDRFIDIMNSNDMIRGKLASESYGYEYLKHITDADMVQIIDRADYLIPELMNSKIGKLVKDYINNHATMIADGKSQLYIEYMDKDALFEIIRNKPKYMVYIPEKVFKDDDICEEVIYKLESIYSSKNEEKYSLRLNKYFIEYLEKHMNEDRVKFVVTNLGTKWNDAKITYNDSDEGIDVKFTLYDYVVNNFEVTNYNNYGGLDPIREYLLKGEIPLEQMVVTDRLNEALGKINDKTKDYIKNQIEKDIDIDKIIRKAKDNDNGIIINKFKHTVEHMLRDSMEHRVRDVKIEFCQKVLSDVFGDDYKFTKVDVGMNNLTALFDTKYTRPILEIVMEVIEEDKTRIANYNKGATNQELLSKKLMEKGIISFDKAIEDNENILEKRKEINVEDFNERLQSIDWRNTFSELLESLNKPKKVGLDKFFSTKFNI